MASKKSAPVKAKSSKKSIAPAQAKDAAGPDLARAEKLVLELMGVPGKSGEEKGIADVIRKHLISFGAKPAQIRSDEVFKKSPLPGGACGNLVLDLPGTIAGPRRMLMAHLDTVPICVGCKPQREGDFVRSAKADTGLGADNRSGCAVLLNTVREILTRKLPHGPLTFCWFVQEEVGLNGSRYVDKKFLANPTMAFNWDGGPASKMTIGATGGYRMTIDVHGIASHAGVAPDWGVSAIAIAGVAIADLHHRSWHGAIHKAGHHGTSNIGVIQGGDATNVVTDRVFLRAEARSHDKEFREKIVQEIESAFTRAAATVRNNSGACGSVHFDGRLDYEAFKLAEDSPVILEAENVIKSLGLDPVRAISNGGLDANWTSVHGIPTVTMGAGQMNPHMVTEALDLRQFRLACQIALKLATS